MNFAKSFHIDLLEVNIYKLEEVQDISNIKDTKFREAYVKDYWKANTKIRKGGRLCHHGQSVE